MELKSIEDLKGHPRNPRKITGEAIAGLKVSLAKFGDISGIVWNKRTGELIAGHQRLRALKDLYGGGLELHGEELTAPTGESWPVRVVDWDEPTAMAALLAANNAHIAGDWEDEGLQEMLEELQVEDAELFQGLRLEELIELPLIPEHGPGLVERFGVPPFTVLDSRQGYWQDRKAMWIAQGIASEAGRGDDLLWSDSSQPPAIYKLRNRMRSRDGHDPSWEEVHAEAKKIGIKERPLTSIFDPVLCELAIRWFCPEGGLILDPFAGGSVRGIVAGLLGRKYNGIDLRQEQVDENERQWAAMNHESKESVEWFCGDSRTQVYPGAVDFVLSCPPYGDLERYSDDPRDLSTMNTGDFRKTMEAIINRCALSLKENRFAVWVIGNIRDKSGALIDLAGDAIAAWEKAGLRLHNDAILITPAVSVPMRAAAGFDKSRKLGRCHQSVLVFVKGDAKIATQDIGPVDFGSDEDSGNEP